VARRETATGGRRATEAIVPGIASLSIGRPAALPEPDGFAWKLLSEVARLESGHTPSRDRPDYWDGSIPWVGIRDATRNHGRKIFDSEQHVSQGGIDNSSARLLPKDTVCLSRTASVGYVVQLGRPMATSQDFVNWVCGAELSPNYLRYLLVSEAESVRRFAHGSVHATMYYPDAKALHVLLPSLNEQQAIAEVLGALDDKIAANTELISSVHQVADAAYRTSLEDGPPTSLGAVAQFHNRRRVPLSASERQNRPGSVSYYGANGQIGKIDAALFDEPLVLMGEDGSVAHEDGTPFVHYVWGPLWVNNHAHVLTGDGISTELLSVILRGVDVSTLVTGAVQPKLSMGQARRIEFMVPGPNKLPQLESFIGALFASVRMATEENRTLAATRDALLPQLMSGKLRVRDAGAAASAAGA